jgi:glycosyltransferase involved in cell wall biosynthesis
VELTWTRRQLKPLMPFLRHVIRVADAVTANSSYTAGLIRQVHDRTVVRVPFGATVDPPAAGQESAPAGQDFDILFVGRLVERKGVQYLLEAIRLLDDLPVRLRVVGDGPMRGALFRRAQELGISDRVEFAGLVSNVELADRFRHCDVFVLPAVVDRKGDVEGLGVVLIEALSYGKPVIASAAGGIVDVVRDGETGLLVPPGDAEALAAALRQVADSPDAARTLGEAGRLHVEREFSWTAIINRLMGVYEEVVRSRGARRRS